MTQLVLTIVGDDRIGLVQALAEVVSAHGGNWERSELAELAGTFAGIVLVSVPDDRAVDLTAALDGLDGLMRVQVHRSATDAAAAASASTPPLRFTVLGNDRPGIVREVSHAVSAHALSIDSFASRTLDAPMAGGTLFEASVVVRMPEGTDPATVVAALERLASEIQVDLTLA